LKKSGGFAVDEPPQGSVNGPVGQSSKSVFCYNLPVLYKFFQLLFIC